MICELAKEVMAWTSPFSRSSKSSWDRVRTGFPSRSNTLTSTRTTLSFTRDSGAPGTITIPAGTRAMDADVQTDALLGRDRSTGPGHHVLQPASVAVPGVLDLVGAELLADIVLEVAGDGDIEGLLLDQHRAQIVSEWLGAPGTR